MLTPLDPAEYRDIVRRALEEDIGTGDITSEAIVNRRQRARGVFVAKAPCVLAGLQVSGEVFRQIEPDVRIIARSQDGDRCAVGDEIATVEGLARTLLSGERTALNFLQRLSGIATITREFVDRVAGRTTVLDTRKTTPTLRVLEKYAVAAAGGTNHRRGLFDAVLIKDNHVRLAGGVRAVVCRMREQHPDRPIEVEAQSLDEVDEALDAGVQTLLADNLTVEDLREAIKRARGRAKVEISGGVTLAQIDALAAVGADYISVGALTHSAPAVDISFEIEPLAES